MNSNLKIRSLLCGAAVWILLALPLALPAQAPAEKGQGAEKALSAGAEATHATPGGEGEAAEGHAAHPPEKTPAAYISQAVWSIASFLIVLAILMKKMFPAIIQSMDKRAGEIRDALAAAEKAKAEAQEMMARHEASLEKARKESAAIVEEGKADAVRLKDSILAGAKKDSEEMVARARREIEQAKVSAMDELTRRSIQLSLELSSRLIRKNLSADEQQGLIQETIRGMPAA